MVEFGAPLHSTKIAAKAMGLDFFCNTDHSYDLDDKPGSWTEADPSLEKWHKSRNEIHRLNNEKPRNTFIIPSEELTLHNHNGRNICVCTRHHWHNGSVADPQPSHTIDLP